MGANMLMCSLWVVLLGSVPDAGPLPAVEVEVTRYVERRLGDDAPRVSGLPERPLFAEGRGGRTFAVVNEGPTQQTERWRLFSVVEGKAIELARANSLERAVGIAWHGDALRLAIVIPDRSSEYSASERTTALLRNDAQRLAGMAGPPQGALVTLGPDGRELARERLTEQRPAGLCATSDGWLTMLTEGTLKNGLGDAMVWARAPGEKWERLAVGLQMPGQLKCRGPWACHNEMTAAGTFLAHCVSPAKRAHWKSKPFKTNVLLDDLVSQPSWRLVFTELSVTGDPSPQWAMPLR